MRLDEQPGEGNARGGAKNAAPREEKRQTAAKGRPRPVSASAGNSAMGDALAAAFGKKR